MQCSRWPVSSCSPASDRPLDIVSPVTTPLSWPGLARPPTTVRRKPAEDVGDRDKPGHDNSVVRIFEEPVLTTRGFTPHVSA
jgi:hypothetical protein